MNFSFYSDPAMFTEFADIWQILLQKSSVNHPFLTSQFLSAWWNHFGTGELSILAFKNDKHELQAIFPFFSILEEDRTRTLLWIGDKKVSDYLDVIVPQADSSQFWSEFAQLSKTQLGWKSLHLISLPANSSTRQSLKKIAQQNGWSFSETQQSVCPVIKVPKSWDEYLSLVEKKQRHEIRRKWKNLDSQTQLAFEIVERDSEVEQATRDFIRLHRLSSEEKTLFWTDNMEKYFSSLIDTAAKNGWLKLYFLRINNERAATMLCFYYNQQLYVFNSGFDSARYAQLSVGQVLTAYTIQDAIRLGCTRYDFLRGEEEYKFRYGAVAEPIFDLLIHR